MVDSENMFVVVTFNTVGNWAKPRSSDTGLWARWQINAGRNDGHVVLRTMKGFHIFLKDYILHHCREQL